jgi:hypothetical protein
MTPQEIAALTGMAIQSPQDYAEYVKQYGLDRPLPTNANARDLSFQGMDERTYSPNGKYVLPTSFDAAMSGMIGLGYQGTNDTRYRNYVPGVGLVNKTFTNATGHPDRPIAGTNIGFDFVDPRDKNYQIYGTRGADGGVDYRREKIDRNQNLKGLAAVLGAAGAGQLALGGNVAGGAVGAGEAGAGLGGAGGYAGAAGDFGLLSPGASTIGAEAASSGLGGLGASNGLSGATSAASTAASSGGLFDTLKTAGSGAMSLLNGPLGAAALGGVLGGVGGSKEAGTNTITTRQEIDPRMASMLYGADGKSGLLGQISGYANTPQSAGNKSYGTAIDQFLQSPTAANSVGSLYGAASSLANSNISTPTIKAPKQNSINLAPAYKDMIYGDPGANPYLTGGIQKGINQSNTAFENMLSDATKNLTQNVLPNIRGGAMSAGQYGGSRQGLAEGTGLSSFNDQIGRAISQYGQNNTDAAVAAQAGAYNTDRDRAASLTSSLGAQQYGLATNQAQLQAQTNQQNSANKIAGIGAASGLMGNYAQQGQNQADYGLNQAGKVSSLLSPYTGLGGSTSQNSPMYENKAAGILGGVTTGLGLYNAYNNANQKPNQG